ncbi:MAG: hypothetical protein Q4G67_06280, partial [Actinomycetia bacterium]|nr:hypothetical protein [Actinomycetes bacterium]
MSSTSGSAAQGAPAPPPAAGGIAVAAPPPPAPRQAASPQQPDAADALSARSTAVPSALASPDVPTALGRWQVLLTTAVVVWALLTAGLLGNSALQARAGLANTTQLTGISDIQSSLFRADAIATNAFLIGGLEPAEQRAAYDAALDEATVAIVTAADAQPADRNALAVLNTQVLRYAEQMQQARANNRQGLPVGAQYLREASTELRSGTQPVLQALVDANNSRATGALTGYGALIIVLPGLALLLLLGWFNQQLAQAFRRRFNVGLLAAAGIVAAVTIAATAVTWNMAASADSLREGPFGDVISLSQARAAAADAKSNESLRLIARGSGAQYEEGWTEAAAATRTTIAAQNQGLVIAWEAYEQGHAEIVAADEGGDWDEAVRLATAREDGTATATFIEFDEAAEAEIGLASKAVTSTLSRGSWLAAGAAIATLLAMVAAVAALSRG